MYKAGGIDHLKGERAAQGQSEPDDFEDEMAGIHFLRRSGGAKRTG